MERVQAVRLIAIERDGSVAEPIGSTPEMANVIEMTVKMYEARGFVPPWLAYVALVDGGVVGTCAFTSPPNDGRVEIAYFTFPSFEGRGVATAMARELIAVARSAGIAVFAHTLPQRNASTTILERLGFRFAGTDDHPEDGVIWRWDL